MRFVLAEELEAPLARLFTFYRDVVLDVEDYARPFPGTPRAAALVSFRAEHRAGRVRVTLEDGRSFEESPSTVAVAPA